MMKTNITGSSDAVRRISNVEMKQRPPSAATAPMYTFANRCFIYSTNFHPEPLLESDPIDGVVLSQAMSSQAISSHAISVQLNDPQAISSQVSESHTMLSQVTALHGVPWESTPPLTVRSRQARG